MHNLGCLPTTASFPLKYPTKEMLNDALRDIYELNRQMKLKFEKGNESISQKANPRVFPYNVDGNGRRQYWSTSI